MLLLVVSGLVLVLVLVLVVATAARWRRPGRRDEVDRFSNARSLTSTWASQGPLSSALLTGPVMPANRGDQAAEG